MPLSNPKNILFSLLKFNFFFPISLFLRFDVNDPKFCFLFYRFYCLSPSFTFQNFFFLKSKLYEWPSNLLIKNYTNNYEPIRSSSTNNRFKICHLLWKTSWSFPLKYILFLPNFQTFLKLYWFCWKYSRISTFCSSSVSLWK